MSDIMTNTQMDGMTDLQQCRMAITHVLGVIRERADICYLLGFGTQTFALLTEAMWTLMGDKVSLRELREGCLHPNPCDPKVDMELVEEAARRRANDICDEEYRGEIDTVIEILNSFPRYSGVIWANPEMEQLLEALRDVIESERAEMARLRAELVSAPRRIADSMLEMQRNRGW